MCIGCYEQMIFNSKNIFKNVLIVTSQLSKLMEWSKTLKQEYLKNVTWLENETKNKTFL